MTPNRHYAGLTDSQVAESRKIHGGNILTPPPQAKWWKLLLEKFSDPLIIILLIAGALSIGIAVYEYMQLGQGPEVFFEPVGIFMAIALATGLSYIFEARANKAFKILNQVNDDEPVEVVRNKMVTTIPRKDVVVGDIVMLNTGDEIPADGELLDCITLSVDESSLTGEPSARKTTDPGHFDKDATYPSNHVMRGSKVMEGHGVMRVLKVGDDTEMGGVFQEAQIDKSVKTPLNEQLDRLAKWISNVSYIIACMVIVGQLIHLAPQMGDMSLPQILAHVLKTLMIAVTLIVVAVPEGLPMAVTLSLAYSMRRMLKTNNLVRKMHACETMGATTVICTDKTGTLTQNQMQVYKADFFGNPSNQVIYEGIAANSTAQLDVSKEKPVVLGNPTEGALLLWLRERGVDYTTLRENAEHLEELPFSTDRKYMATVVKSTDGKRILYVKGAPEIVFGMCGDTAGVTKEEIDARLMEYQGMAMRTLGFAYCELPADGKEVLNNGKIESGSLIFLGIVAISDPVRADVPDAVREVLNAGIKVKIVTGDTPGTAKEIGRQVGLWDDTVDSDVNIITGPEVAGMTDEELRDRVGELKIIARARPLDKKRLVEALQANNEVVAVTGDGTNDAPALRAAHVGLSMGDGTSVAKEASDITIIDNSFSSIGRAVMWGRSLYQNIQRFLLFQLTVNVAACLLVMFGSFFGTESPLTVTQMLWVNLIMDTFGAMALASLPPSPGVMKNKPRDRNAFIINRPMLFELIGVGVIFFALTFGFYILFNHVDIKSLKDLLHFTWGSEAPISVYDMTLLFSIFVWTHFWYMFDARAFETSKSLFRLKMSQGFWTIVLIIVIGQLFITELVPDFFNVEPMLRTADWKWNPSGAEDLGIIILASSAVVWVRELYILVTWPFRKNK